MPGCLTDSQIAGMASGSLAEVELAAVESHLAECPDCARLVAGEARDAALVAEIREALRDSEMSSTVAGDEIEGYELLGEIHRGGQGVVYRARQRATRRLVALKLVIHGHYASERERRRFEREIDILTSLRHPHIVTVYDGGVSDGRPYYAMELVEGEPLSRRTKELAQRPVPDVVGLFRDMCAAVAHAHAHGVIHRDLKPANILVDAEGKPRLLDFGLAKDRDEVTADGLTMSGEFLGTLAYAAPEQTRGTTELIDVRADVYALGVILFQMLTDELPYPVGGTLSEVIANITERAPRSPRSLRPEIGDELETILLKALSKAPERRYASAVELEADVSRFLEGRPIAAKRDSTMYLLRTTLRRYRLATSVTLGFLLVVLLGFGVSLWFGLEEKRAREDAEFGTYVANLSAADSALQIPNVDVARRRLDRAPAAHRNWEWYYLGSRLDHSERTLPGTAKVNDVALDDSGAIIATASSDGTVRIWRRADAVLIEEFEPHEGAGAANTIAFASQRGLVAVGYMDGAVVLFEARRAGTRRELARSARCINAVAFSPDESALAAGGGYSGEPNNSVLVWRVDDGEELHELRGHPHQIYAVAFSEDGSRIASGGLAIRVWDANTGAEIWTLEGHESWVDSLEFRADGNRLLSGSYDKTARIWDVVKGKQRRLLKGHRSFVHDAHYCRNGRSVVTASADQTLRIWNAGGGHQERVLWGHRDRISSVAPTETGFVTGSWDGSVRLWREGVPAESRIFTGHGSDVRAVAVSPCGSWVLSGGYDQRVGLWDIETGDNVASLAAHDRSVLTVAWSRDGSRFVSGDDRGGVVLWDGRTRSCLRDFRVTGGAQAACFAPDGAVLIASTDGNVYRLADGDTEASVFMQRGDCVHGVVYDSVGRHLIVADHHRVQVFDAATGEPTHGFSREIGPEDFGLAVHPHEPIVAAAEDAGTIVLFDLVTGEIVHRLAAHRDAVTNLAFSPDGTRLVSASTDGTALLWDVQRGVEVTALRGFESLARSLAFSPDGDRIVAGLYGGPIHVWDGRAKTATTDGGGDGDGR